MGFMFPLTESEARRRYGDRLRVASLGAIPKDDEGYGSFSMPPTLSRSTMVLSSKIAWNSLDPRLARPRWKKLWQQDIN